MMAIRLDAAKAAGQSMVINWHFTDRDEKLVLTLKHCTLTPSPGRMVGQAAVASITDHARHARRHRAGQDHAGGGDAGRHAQDRGRPVAAGRAVRHVRSAAGLMFDILTPDV